MAITHETSVAELSILASEKLREQGLSVILVGGAVVSIYTENRYESGNLDFVIEDFVVRRGAVDDAMKELGFEKTKARVYLHPECRYAVDFSPPPAALGEERVTDPAELKMHLGRVRLYTPTQSVMDRLSAYYHFGDRQGLEQALLVAASHPVDLKKVRSWSGKGNMMETFKDFERRLEALRKTGKQSP